MINFIFMKRSFLVLFLLVATVSLFAEEDKYNYSFNTLQTTLNGVVIEEPAPIEIHLTKDAETGYDMCEVKINGISTLYRVIAGIVRGKVYPTLQLIETNTTNKWELRFLGERVLLFRVGGTRYTFTNEESENVPAGMVEAAAGDEEIAE